MIKIKRRLLLFSLYFLFSSNAYAQKLEQVFHDWNVLSTIVESKKICYIASLPVKQEGNSINKGNPYFLVSLFPERSPEVSYSSGFDIKKDEKVKLNIDGQTILLTKIVEQIAWAENETEDKKVISELKKGIKLKTFAPDTSGHYSFNTFSLKGFTAAYNEMISLCSNQ